MPRVKSVVHPGGPGRWADQPKQPKRGIERKLLLPISHQVRNGDVVGGSPEIAGLELL